jgi:hypothetical protein
MDAHSTPPAAELRPEHTEFTQGMAALFALLWLACLGGIQPGEATPGPASRA